MSARIALVGDRIAGPELVRLGIAQRCVADATVLDEARALCASLAACPPGAPARIKAGLRARLDHAAVTGADAWFDRFTTQSSGAAPPPPA